MNHLPESTREILCPPQLIDRVIGQDRALEIVKLAAQQRRFLLLVGEPGSGKSMLGKAVASLMNPPRPYTAAATPNPSCPMEPYVVHVNEGERLVESSHMQGMDPKSQKFIVTLAIAGLLVSGVWLGLRDSAYLYIFASIGLSIWLWQAFGRPSDYESSKSFSKILYQSHGDSTPFIDATGLTAGALFGDIRHDPYQSGGFHTPPHHLVEAGAIHKAHGGVLYIDEIGGLTVECQKLLLTAIQDKALPITGRQSGSSGAMVRTNPVPCDFVLVAAGNLEDLTGILPALRSRILGYGYEVITEPSMPDTQTSHAKLAQFIAQEIEIDGKIPHFSRSGIEALIDEAKRDGGLLTTRLRDLGGLVRAAGDIAQITHAHEVTSEHVKKAKTLHRPIESWGISYDS